MKEMTVAKKPSNGSKKRNSSAPTAVETPAPTAPTTKGKNMNVFTFVRVNKYGSALYRRGDSRGTVAVNKTLFAGEPPATITIEGVSFAEPGASRLPSPEKIAKLQAAAERAEKRAAKAKEKLEKLNSRLAEPVEASA